MEVTKQVIEEERKGFPDLHVAIEDIIAEGDKVWIRVKETGTYTGEFRGLAATGKLARMVRDETRTERENESSSHSR